MNEICKFFQTVVFYHTNRRQEAIGVKNLPLFSCGLFGFLLSLLYGLLVIGVFGGFGFGFVWFFCLFVASILITLVWVYDEKGEKYKVYSLEERALGSLTWPLKHWKRY